MEEEIKKKENKLSKRDFVLVILVILFLSGATYWNFKTWQKSLGKVELPKFEMPKFEPFLKKEGYKEWTSPDGKLKLKYPADFTEVDFRILENFIKEKIEEKPLFFAQKFQVGMEGVNQSYLMVQESKEKKRLEEVLDEIKKKNEEGGGKMEILNSNKIEDELVFEAKYQKKNGLTFHSLEKIISNEKIYLVTFFTFEKDFQKFQKEGKDIIDSIQLLK
jgi:hypothetical protein